MPRRIGKGQLAALKGNNWVIRTELSANEIKICAAAESRVAQISECIGISRQHPDLGQSAVMDRIVAAQAMVERIRIGMAGQRRIAIKRERLLAYRYHDLVPLRLSRRLDCFLASRCGDI